jgi:hypothetical protein
MSQRTPGELRRPSTVGTLVYLLFGLIVWAAHFTIVYGAHASMCANGFSNDSIVAVILVATGLAIALLVVSLFSRASLSALALRGRVRDEVTYWKISRLVILVSIGAVAWSGVTISIVTAC